GRGTRPRARARTDRAGLPSRRSRRRAPRRLTRRPRAYSRPVSFAVPAEAYDRFMGRYSRPLAREFVAFSRLVGARRVLDVGCGPGALTAELVGAFGAECVAALDPFESFVEAARKRLPGVDVRVAAAERIPFDGDAFDAALAQLVVHFM